MSSADARHVFRGCLRQLTRRLMPGGSHLSLSLDELVFRRMRSSLSASALASGDLLRARFLHSKSRHRCTVHPRVPGWTHRENQPDSVHCVRHTSRLTGLKCVQLRECASLDACAG